MVKDLQGVVVPMVTPFTSEGRILLPSGGRATIAIAERPGNRRADGYRNILEAACHEGNTMMMARYDALNPAALARLVDAGAQVLPFPDEVMEAAKTAAEELMDENAAADADFSEILDHWRAFRAEVQPWHKLAELATLTHGLDLAAG